MRKRTRNFAFFCKIFLFTTLHLLTDIRLRIFPEIEKLFLTLTSGVHNPLIPPKDKTWQNEREILKKDKKIRSNLSVTPICLTKIIKHIAFLYPLMINCHITLYVVFLLAEPSIVLVYSQNHLYIFLIHLFVLNYPL